ncbi:MAG: T9SS type A sorting domain-containing protein [Bacteroidia bacterium]|nr:T9SS type A sorting domain-containing protein [Bacteroidia bacterium]
MKQFRSVLPFLIVGFFGLNLSFASIITVNSLANDGSGSLRESIALANEGDTLQMGLTGTILLDSQLVVDKDLYIFGIGPDTSIIDAQEKDRIFLIQDTTSLWIEGFTLQNGDFSTFLDGSQRPGGGFPDGGAIKVLGSLHGKNLVFAYNRATFGGALTISNANVDMTLVEMENVSFIYNVAGASDGNPGNFGQYGGAIFQFGPSGGGTRFEATNCTFSHNSSVDNGGAFYTEGEITGGTEAEFTHCTFAFNESERGAGVTNNRFSAVFFSRCLFGNNSGRVDQDVRGSVLSRGYNLLETIGPNTQWVPDMDSTDLLRVESRITDLAFFAPLPTHALGCGSPAVDAVLVPTSLTTDQKGQSRIGLPDIGSHEKNIELDGGVYSLAERGAGSLRLAIELACEGDTISLDQLEGSIRLESTLEINKSLKIFGNPTARINLDGGDSLRIMDIDNVSSEIRWFNFQHANPASFGGGAIRNNGEIVIAYCSFFDNTAVSGGAIGNYGVESPGNGTVVSATISNSSFSRNRASVLDGGAVDSRRIDKDVALEMINCTVANNSASNKGGGISSESSGTILRNTLLAYNTAVEGGNDIFGTGTNFAVMAGGTNLIQDSLGSGIRPMPGVREDLYGVDPLLDPLGNYEGPTLSRRLQAGSPAIDAGTDDFASLLLGTDQRGFARIFGTSIDIGAYEYNPATSSNSLEKDVLNASIKTYPNPVTEHWILELNPTASLKNHELHIRDLTGRIIKSVQIQGGKNLISMKALPPGIYFWQLGDFSGKIVRR